MAGTKFRKRLVGFLLLLFFCCKTFCEKEALSTDPIEERGAGKCQLNAAMISCTGISDATHFESYFPRLKCSDLTSYQISLTIENSRVNYIAWHLFLSKLDECNVGAGPIVIKNTYLPFITHPLEPDTNKVEIPPLTLTVEGIEDALHSWSWHSFQGKLSNLHVKKSRFVSLPASFSKTITNNLEKSDAIVSIINSKLKWLGKESLACPKCKRLELHSNQIENLPFNLFGKEDMPLEKLILSNNKIRFIPEGIFSNLVNLEDLSLQGNAIQYINENFFQSLPRTLAIVLIDVYSDCDCNFGSWFHKSVVTLGCLYEDEGPEPSSFWHFYDLECSGDY